LTQICIKRKIFNNESAINVFLNTNKAKNMEGWKNFKAFCKIHYPETKIASINPADSKRIFDADVFTDDFLKEN
jgi:hypothetical protein